MTTEDINKAFCFLDYVCHAVTFLSEQRKLRRNGILYKAMHWVPVYQILKTYLRHFGMFLTFFAKAVSPNIDRIPQVLFYLL